MNKKTRIVEQVDSDGFSRFVIQRKRFGCFWLTWESEMGSIEFSTLDECRKWLNYRRTVNELIHKV